MARRRLKHFLKCRFARSIRVRTLLYFAIFIVINLVVLSVICFRIFGRSFGRVEENVLNSDISRMLTLVKADLSSLQTSAVDYAFWDETVVAVEQHNAGNEAGFNDFIENNIRWDENGFSGRNLGWNIAAIFNTSGDFLFGTYFPPPADESALVGETEQPFPEFLAERSTHATLTYDFIGVVTPPGLESMLIATTPIILEEGGVVFGTFLVARHLETTIASFADVAQVCLASWESHEVAASTDAQEAYAELEPFATADMDAWGNVSYQKHLKNIAQGTQDPRVCPEGDWIAGNRGLSAGYVLLRDPFPDHPAGPLLRVDFARSNKEQLALGILITIEMVALFILMAVFSLFLDRAVLQRLVRLNVLIENTGDDVSSSTATTSTASAMGKTRSGSDEVKHLKHHIRDKLAALGRELDGNKKAIAAEDARMERIMGALRLLNVWCTSNSTAPLAEDGSSSGPPPQSPRQQLGSSTSPAAATTSTEQMLSSSDGGPPLSPRSTAAINLDKILSDSIAVEFLKAHCSGESTSENVMFLVDVQFRKQQLFEAERRLQDVGALRRAWDEWLHQEYFNPESPHSINVGAEATRQATADPPSYDLAVAEVEHLMGCDVIPRFQSSQLYRAMQRAMAFELGTGPDEPFAHKPPETRGLFRAGVRSRTRRAGSLISRTPTASPATPTTPTTPAADFTS